MLKIAKKCTFRFLKFVRFVFAIIILNLRWCARTCVMRPEGVRRLCARMVSKPVPPSLWMEAYGTADVKRTPLVSMLERMDRRSVPVTMRSEPLANLSARGFHFWVKKALRSKLRSNSSVSSTRISLSILRFICCGSIIFLFFFVGATGES